ncbi:maleylpyruvate isomerase N-terminal domain-containing protein [Amycolatopsis sp. WQ 127309]|uniref:maleylpyruvate isomerase N-terminal domain-containing protein n=1 Tax=Amycolatopsis sp. WQ 127309 TaxID=2932773 RepID=UPI001FF62835|nr:maleylpyruvate isomerase N-terminal domain-containing protein [Amycolatopsis sp. WQ 127309]UOZ09741.1 maleylpyruvate isomerase N-terminal domain-containing protein [Amycolatopsis sp. WQ 127309]
MTTASEQASGKARALLDGVRRLDDEWARVAGGLGEPELRAPSALPGWTRAHVVAHVARNADGLRNLLTWANTGVETPMYASPEARDTDIEAGARQAVPDILADFVASAGRFEQYAVAMPDDAWAREARNRQGGPVTGAVVARMRLSELTIHLADLGIGPDLDQVLALLGPLTEDVVQHAITSRGAHLPALRLVTDGFEWTMGDAPEETVTGTPGALLAWLSGRSDGSALDGAVPRVPAWS